MRRAGAVVGTVPCVASVCAVSPPRCWGARSVWWSAGPLRRPVLLRPRSARVDGVAAQSTGDHHSLAEPAAGSVAGQSDALTRTAGASTSGVGPAAEPQCGPGSEPPGAHPAVWDSSGPGPDGRARQLAQGRTAGPDHTGGGDPVTLSWLPHRRAGSLAFAWARPVDRMLLWPLSLLVSQMRKENETLEKQETSLLALLLAPLSPLACSYSLRISWDF